MFAFEPEFYLITFASANHCIATEKQARQLHKVNIIPTPREISASCGMALRFVEWKFPEVETFFEALDVPCQFYVLGARTTEGRRPVEKLGSLNEQ